MLCAQVAEVQSDNQNGGTKWDFSDCERGKHAGLSIWQTDQIYSAYIGWQKTMDKNGLRGSKSQ